MKRFRKIASMLMLAAAVVFAVGCTKPDDPNNGGNNGGGNNGGGNNGGGGNGGGNVTMSITTIEPTNVTMTKVQCGVEVTVPQGETLNLLGVCCSTSQNPTVEDISIIDNEDDVSFVGTLADLEPGTTYYVRAFARLRSSDEYYYGTEKSFTTHGYFGTGSSHNGNIYIDLGLPSGTLWAVCNVGASQPEGYGYYFAWGEVEPKNFYSWSNYKYCKGASNQLTKYCTNEHYGFNGFTDNLSELEPDDDAAVANWGGGWCTPTSDEMIELRNNCESAKWITLNGVKGRRLVFPNGNCLFFPAAGCVNEAGDHLFGDVSGYYWSSTINTVTPQICTGFFVNSTSAQGRNLTRDSGIPVRAVYHAK